MLNIMRRALRKAVDQIDDLTGSRYRIVYYKEAHAPFEQEMLKKAFSFFDVDCVFDVGANVGQYASMLRQKVGFKGTIISFEPVPECIEQLNRLSKGDPKWFVEPLALSEAAGDSSFNVMTNSQFSSLASPAGQDGDPALAGNHVSQKIMVKIDTLNSQFEKYARKIGFKTPFLKMDTQGNDLKVVAGGTQVIRRFVALQSELSIVPLYSDVPDYRQSMGVYEDQGFVLSALIPNNPGHFPHLYEIDCLMANRSFIK